MNSLDSMTKKLENTKIYAVKPGGRNYAEIKAFSVGLLMNLMRCSGNTI